MHKVRISTKSSTHGLAACAAAKLAALGGHGVPVLETGAPEAALVVEFPVHNIAGYRAGRMRIAVMPRSLAGRRYLALLGDVGIPIDLAPALGESRYTRDRAQAAPLRLVWDVPKGRRYVLGGIVEVVVGRRGVVVPFVVFVVVQLVLPNGLSPRVVPTIV